MAARFPYVSMSGTRGEASLMPMLPIELQLPHGEPVHALGLLDSGATVNVLPYRLGLRLGAEWEKQTTRVPLAGNLAAQDARALLVDARVADFSPMELVFAWTRAENVPLLLGQFNFFHEFAICFHRAERRFDVTPVVR